MNSLFQGTPHKVALTGAGLATAVAALTWSAFSHHAPTQAAAPPAGSPAATAASSLDSSQNDSQGKKSNTSHRKPGRKTAKKDSISSPGDSSTNDAPAASGAPGAKTALAGNVIIHVAGRVKRPDVYTLPASDRVIDAVQLAGGALPDADLNAINLAAHIQDGEQVYVPSHAEVSQPAEASGGTGGRSRSSSGRRGSAQMLAISPIPPGRMPLAGPAALRQVNVRSNAEGRRRSPGRTGHSSRSDKLTDPSQGVININVAGVDELVRLPGVGPSTADRIVAFRMANGPFRSVEDVMNVKGIGPAKFARMKLFIVVH